MNKEEWELFEHFFGELIGKLDALTSAVGDLADVNARIANVAEEFPEELGGVLVETIGDLADATAKLADRTDPWFARLDSRVCIHCGRQFAQHAQAIGERGRCITGDGSSLLRTSFQKHPIHAANATTCDEDDE